MGKLKKRDFELKVGIFVFIGLIILSLIVFSISDFKTAVAGYYIKVIFNFANGIEVGAPVRLAGVKVGEVKDLRIVYPSASALPYVELLAWIDKRFVVYKDSIAYINTLGLLGEKYLEIIPGSEKSEVLKPADILYGKNSVSMAQITETGYKIATQLEASLSSITNILADPEFKTTFKETIRNVKRLAGELEELSSSLQEIVDKIKRGEGTVGKLVNDERLYNEMDDFLQDLKKHPWKLFYRPREKR
ncbi:MAG: MlaD family protein [Candidatus Omnitrophica bacterium]|nr:MlaD family protein [Candidatus Omnitrophota bacterium]